MTSCQHCCQSGSGANSQSPLLEKLLPEGYNHLVCTYEETGEGQFKAHIKLRITSKDEVHKWLVDFQTSSQVTWRKSKTYPQTGYNAYRVDLRCQHKTSNPKNIVKKTKNTSCCATMYLVLKKKIYSQDRTSRSLDPHIKDGYLFNTSLRHEHNHRLFCAKALQKRDVSTETTDKLKILFESGHSPSTALDTIKYDLQDQEGDDYIYSEEESMDEVLSISRCDTSGISSGEDLKAMVNQFCRSITEKLENDPQTFAAPIRAWLKSYNKMNDSSLISALHCFGKVPQAKAKYLQSSKLIGVQPTAIARRKTAVGGRRALIPGRPPKCSRKEHHYSKENRKKSSPHSPVKCAEDNTCLGGHH